MSFNCPYCSKNVVRLSGLTRHQRTCKSRVYIENQWAEELEAQAAERAIFNDDFDIEFAGEEFAGEEFAGEEFAGEEFAEEEFAEEEFAEEEFAEEEFAEEEFAEEEFAESQRSQGEPAIPREGPRAEEGEADRADGAQGTGAGAEVDGVDVAGAEMTTQAHLNREEADSSIAQPIITTLFQTETGRTAATTVNPNRLPSHVAEKLFIQPEPPAYRSANWWAPFPSETTYAQCAWWLRASTSKPAINDYLHDQTLKQMVNIKNYSQINNWLYEIPYGIPNDTWYNSTITLTNIPSTLPLPKLTILHRDITNCLRFLIGHRPFAKHLSWAPVRQFNYTNRRMYSEMNTGTWWWEMQEKLPSGATVVPLLLASDKTQLTKLRGDICAWPVYISIGNLSRNIRKQQKVPSKLLLGLIPIPSGLTHAVDANVSRAVKSHLYHESLRLMLKPLEKLSKYGAFFHCADGLARYCYPILANFSADYEEQALITGIKYLQQCVNCQCPPNERQHILRHHPLRTHKQMKAQIIKQAEDLDGLQGARGGRSQLDSQRGERSQPRPKTKQELKSSPDWVHMQGNFAWSLPRCNIYECMTVDVLHQVYKGLLTDLLGWVEELLAGLYPRSRSSARRGNRRLYHDSIGMEKLDARFRQVTHFPELKHISCYSTKSQWTGADQKDIIRVLVAVLAPLLVPVPDVLEYVKAVADVATLFLAPSFDDETLGFIEHALDRMYKTRTVFRHQRKMGKDGLPHWNYPKWHALSHYTQCIRRFGGLDGYNTDAWEAAHKYLLKEFFNRTNKGKTYNSQLAVHNTKLTNMLGMASVHAEAKYTGLATLRSELPEQFENRQTEITSKPSTPLLLEKFPVWSGLTPDIRYMLERYKLPFKTTTTVGVAESLLQLRGFTKAVAHFLQHCRHGADGSAVGDVVASQGDSGWVKDFPIQLFGSLKCWKRHGKKYMDSEEQVHETIRCNPNWFYSEGPRNDFCWVQELNPEEDSSEFLRGRRVGLLQAVVKIFDIDNWDGYTAIQSYSGAAIDLMVFLDQGQPSPYHGMIEVAFSKGRARTFETQMYPLDTIIRSAHIIPADLPTSQEQGRCDKYLINNYIDWDQYQLLYADNWMEVGLTNARRIEREHKRILVEEQREFLRDPVSSSRRKRKNTS
ncbi:hypothetical protein NHQ30_011297 [Ciborinia camelliae]|nr:hypothetical protein NHQ30_011297 [Ciborinia camelliae]